MSTTKYHIAQSGKNAGKWVRCTANYKCPIGGEHREVDNSEKDLSRFFGGEVPLPLDDSKIARAGYNQHGKAYAIASPNVNTYKDFLNKAVDDGWSVYEGPYGMAEGGRTVRLEKYDPELDGKFSILFTDRDFKNLEGSVAYNRDGATTLMQNVEGYFVADTGEGYAHSEHSLKLPKSDFFREGGNYDYQTFVNAAGTCDRCKKNVGKANLSHVAFANAMCPDCVEQGRAELETPGWYN